MVHRQMLDHAIRSRSMLAVSEAAERLGVSTRQVQHLVARGELRSLARGVVDETSVERLLAVRRGCTRGRGLRRRRGLQWLYCPDVRRGGWGRPSGPGYAGACVAWAQRNWSGVRVGGPG